MSFDIFKCEIQSVDNGESDRSTVSFANRKKLCNEEVKEINTKAVKQRGRLHMTRISHSETGLSKNYDTVQHDFYCNAMLTTIETRNLLKFPYEILYQVIPLQQFLNYCARCLLQSFLGNYFTGKR